MGPTQRDHWVALIGNPNCGKTLLFNRLTSQHAAVGNWSGVTVERQESRCLLGGLPTRLIDLPGCYQLTHREEAAPADASITRLALDDPRIDRWLHVVDACQLERPLSMTVALRERGLPLTVVVNRIDFARKQGIHVDTERLARVLGCPVVAVSAMTGEGLEALKATLAAHAAPSEPPTPCFDHWPLPLRACLEDRPKDISLQDALSLMEDDATVQARYRDVDEVRTWLSDAQELMACAESSTLEVMLVEARYRVVREALGAERLAPRLLADRSLDRWFLHRWLGLPLFLMIMYAVFYVAVRVGGLFQEALAQLGHVWVVQGLATGLTALHVPGTWVRVLSSGVGMGWVTTVSFLPIIATLFTVLTWLEDSGYMARAALVMDRVMVALGLPGRAFVAMVIGFGCNVPAVMAARHCDSQRDRIVTALVAPFMSCSARLTVYTVLVGAFFPTNGHNVVFGLYVLGIAMAMLTGWILQHSVLAGEPSPLVMELPPYQRPVGGSLRRVVGRQAKGFVRRACRWVIPVTTVLACLQAWGWLPLLGKAITPLFHPMGLTDQNWPAVVALLAGAVAKEVVIGTLGALYGQMAHVAQSATVIDAGAFVAWALQQSWSVVVGLVHELVQLPLQVLMPWRHTDVGMALQPHAYQVMVTHFRWSSAALSYCIFVLLYMPCVSTLVAIHRELNWRWATFAFGWSLSLAYVMAVWVFQMGQLSHHPWQALAWMGGMLAVGGLWYVALKRTAAHQHVTPACAPHALMNHTVQGLLAPTGNAQGLRGGCASCEGGCKGCGS